MQDFARIDWNFRPRTYFVREASKAAIGRIKGSARREFVKAVGLQAVDEVIAAPSLSARELLSVGRADPRLMGGEFLPDVGPMEVEIARVDMASTTGDAISIRARRTGRRITYSCVDEYQTDYQPRPRTTQRPLTFRQLVKMIGGMTAYEAGQGLLESLREANLAGDPYPSSERLEELAEFAWASSDFYPELGAYFMAEAEAWLVAKLTEHGLTRSRGA